MVEKKGRGDIVKRHLFGKVSQVPLKDGDFGIGTRRIFGDGRDLRHEFHSGDPEGMAIFPPPPHESDRDIGAPRAHIQDVHGFPRIPPGTPFGQGTKNR